MKIKSVYLFIIVFLINGSLKAQDAHNNIIDNVFADMRGQVFMTIDRDETAKVWDVSDGKLLVSLSKNSVDWHPKLLRYKINHPDYTLKGFEDKLVYEGGIFKKEYRLDGTLVAKGKNEGNCLYNPESKKILVQNINANSNTVLEWLTFENNEPVIKPHLILPYIAQYETSPKAIWLMSVRAEEVMNFETGKVIKLPTNSGMLKSQFAKFTFNADETELAVATEDGISVIDIGTASVVRRIKLPKKIKEKEGYIIYPLSDMQSFIYTGNRYAWSGKGSTKRAWLVKESGFVPIKE